MVVSMNLKANFNGLLSTHLGTDFNPISNN